MDVVGEDGHMNMTETQCFWTVSERANRREADSATFRCAMNTSLHSESYENEV